MRPARAAAVFAILAVAVPAGRAAAEQVVPVPPLAEPAAPGMVRRLAGLCLLEAPKELSPVLDRLADQAVLLLKQVEWDLGMGPAAPYRIFLIPRVMPAAGSPSDPGSSAVPGSSGAAAIRELDRLAPEWAAGFLLPSRRLGAIRLAQADRYPHADLGSVLAHEATHMILFDAAGDNLPRWFGEGVATGIERSWGMRDILVFSSSLLTGRLPPLAELDAAFDWSDDRARAAYAASFDFMLFTVKRYGDGVVREIVREAASRPFPEAWEAATGVSLERSEAEWRRGSLFLYRWIPALTGTTALWSGITLLALYAGAHRRARSRAILERWEAEERPPAPRDDDEVVH
jgi:hypothetical protein